MLAVLSAFTGGYLYYASVKDAALKEAERQAVVRLELIAKNLASYLSENIKVVKALAGMDPLLEMLVRPGPEAQRKANAILDLFKAALQVDVCYLMNYKGDTVASSNRNAPDSFVGKNFEFRPYFQEAFHKAPATYLALGVTSGKRGVYYSYPIFEKGEDLPLGVVVIKGSIELIEKELSLLSEEIVLVTDPRGVVFISNAKSWLYRVIWKITPEERTEIARSRQFGDGPWDWIGLKKKKDNYVVDQAGIVYQMHQADIDREHYPGWKAIYLRSLNAISGSISDPLIKVTGPLVLALCLLVGSVVFFLYRKASKEISQRKAFEKALRLAKEELSRYSKDLERQVEIRTREITSILKYTPAVVYIKDIQGRYLLVNSRYEEIFGVKNEDVRGKTDYEILPQEVAIQFRAYDLDVLDQNRSCQVEERLAHSDGIHTYLSVKFPVYDESGNTRGVCGIATDITAVKKAQDQLRRLSGSIMTNQEKERSVIARELHDELGQVLTALRMDAVWIQEHLAGIDTTAAERALTMGRLIDKTIENVRSLAFRLRPGVLDDLGLVDALELYTTDFEKRTGITCVFDRQNLPGTNDTVATAAYRIAQEALTNVARHARASNVEVVLGSADGILTLTVMDNGRGFDASDLGESEGLGLAGMRERAGLAGGLLEVKAQPDIGTCVYFKVPIDGMDRTS